MGDRDLYKDTMHWRAANELGALRGAIDELGRSADGRPCFCQMKVGNPMVREHSNGCSMARAAIMLRG